MYSRSNISYTIRMKQETIEKMRRAAYTRDNTNRLKAIPKGKNHWRYSEKPTVSAIHKWINKWHGRASKCESKTHNPNIKAKKYDWALKHGKEYKKDIKVFFQLCRSCHVKYDYTEERREKTREITKARYK